MPAATSTEIHPLAFAELPELGDTGERCSWGVFGAGDELGTVNRITPDVVAAAAATVSAGELVDLALTLDEPAPPLAVGRGAYHHEVLRSRSGRDDRLDGFHPQASTQWDGLGHIRFREFGYYNGRSEDDLDAGELSIAAISRHGILTRGVLVDFAGWAADEGRPVDPTQRVTCGPGELDAVLAAQRTELRPGDVLLLRTGWLQWYLGLDASRRAGLAATLHNDEGGLVTPGLDPGRGTAAWLWDHGVAAVAADNPSLEALHVRREEGFLHRRILALLGMPIGEFWRLDDLAEACRRHRRHTFLLSATPWPLTAGSGSPVTPQAIL